jgi:hypothetical protein
MRIRARALAVAVVAIVPLLLADVGVAAVAGASTASTAKTYVVVLKGNQKAGLAAIQQAGGQVLEVNKLGIGQVSSDNPSFLATIRHSGAVDAAANDASWHLGRKDLVSVTYVPAADQAANCRDFYQVPINMGRPHHQRITRPVVRGEPGRRGHDRRHGHRDRPHPPRHQAEP